MDKDGIYKKALTEVHTMNKVAGLVIVAMILMGLSGITAADQQVVIDIEGMFCKL